MSYKRLFSIIFMFFCLLLMFTKTNNKTKYREQVVRNSTYNYNNDSLVYGNLDYFDVKHDDNSISLVAQKLYKKDYFDEINLVSLDNNSDEILFTFEIEYLKEDSIVNLTVNYSDGNFDENIIEVLPGLVTLNDNLEPDVLFVEDGERFWLSDIENYSVIDNTGLWKIVRKVVKKVSDSPVGKAVVNCVAEIAAPLIRYATTILYISGLGSLATWIGSKALNMSQEYEKNSLGIYMPTGIYHANFDCWQQYLGYDDFYDEVFDSGTAINKRKRMERKKYEIDIDGDLNSDYILWAWKGDYYNLGAGCELGIYEKVNHKDYGLVWKCATNRAFSCKLKLNFCNKTIINWNNNGNKHWWFTGFNSNIQYPILYDIEALTASFEVTFNMFSTQRENDIFFNAFHKTYKLSIENSKDRVKLDHWNCWTINGTNDYNGMTCHVASLKF